MDLTDVLILLPLAGGLLVWLAPLPRELSAGLAFLILNASGRSAARVAACVIVAAPFLMPGPAVAIALIAAWNHAGWRAAVYDGPQILVLAGAARFAAVGVLVLAAAGTSRAREWDDAARVFAVLQARMPAPLTWPAKRRLLVCSNAKPSI